MMQCRQIAMLALCALSLSACGADAGPSSSAESDTVDENAHPSTDDARVEATPIDDPEDATNGAALAPIHATSIEGIWIFSHEPNGWGQANIVGDVTIEDGCLRVAGVVVLWHRQLEAYTRGLVEAALAGGTPTATIVGGAYGEPFVPTEVKDLCGPQEFVIRAGLE